MLKAQKNILSFLSFLDRNDVILKSEDLSKLYNIHLDRLRAGKTYDNDIIGYYAESTIRKKIKKGAEWRWVTLSDTFLHYKTLRYIVNNSKLLLEYVVEYSKYFLARYGKERVMKLSRDEKLLVVRRTLYNYFNSNG